MTFSGILSLFQAISPFISIGLVCLLVPTSLSRCGLSDELTEAKADLTVKTEQIKGYEAKIALQNQTIEVLDLQSRAAEQRFDRAAAAAETQNKKLDKTIAQLKAYQGKSCDDAMTLVDKIIRRGN